MSAEFKESYETTSGIAILISAIGWLVLVGGGYFVYAAHASGQEKLLGAAVALFIGFSFIVTGQMMRAIIDNTNANREILHLLKMEKVTDFERTHE